MSAADTTGTAQPSATAGVLDLLEVRALYESGKGAGKLDAEEIALALDELDLEPAQLDEFYTALEEAQVARCVALQGQPDLVRSATRFPWWQQRIKKRQGPRTP